MSIANFVWDVAVPRTLNAYILNNKLLSLDMTMRILARRQHLNHSKLVLMNFQNLVALTNLNVLLLRQTALYSKVHFTYCKLLVDN